MVDPESNINTDTRLSLGKEAARNLATTTKSAPQMQEISSRWLLSVLPWVQVQGGVFRLNRRLSYALGDGRVSFMNTGAEIQVIPRELCELSLLRGFEDDDILGNLAERFEQKEYESGDLIVELGKPADQIVLIAHGKVEKIGPGKYGDETVLGVLADGDYFTYQALLESQDYWEFTAKATTRCTVLTLSQKTFEEVLGASPSLQAHIDAFKSRAQLETNELGEAAIALS